MRKIFDKALDFHRRGKLAEAKALYKKILKTFPDNPDTNNLLGQIEFSEGNREKGIELIKKAVSAAPDEPLYRENLANVYYKDNKPDMAETECNLVLRLNSSSAQALNIMGMIYRDRQEYQKALNYFSQAIEIKKTYTEAIKNLSSVLYITGNYDLAEKYIKLVMTLEPDNPAHSNDLGLVLIAEKDLAGAKKAFENAGEYIPAKFNLGYTYLLEDNLEKGLPLNEYRKKILNIGKDLNKPEWDGNPYKDKTLLVIHEQGMGDTILMSRFYSGLPGYFKKVYVQVQEPLLRLMQTIDPGAEIISGTENPEHDFRCYAMSLPLLLGIKSAGEIPKKPWFNLPETDNQKGKLKFGLNWAGKPSYKYDYFRSAHLENLKILLQVPDVEWYSLHKGHLEHEADEFGLKQPLKDAKDFYDTALFIKTLDLVVSTETAIPNLSAALGVRTCVLTNTDYPNWRWKSWYDNVVVCPQEIQGNWFAPVLKVLGEIKKLMEKI